MLIETCSLDSKDITWVHGLDEGLASAKQSRRPVIVKPLGQGLDDFDTW